MERDSLLKIADAAKRLSISVRSLYRRIAEGDLPHPVRVGNCARLYESDIASYLDRLRSERRHR